MAAAETSPILDRLPSGDLASLPNRNFQCLADCDQVLFSWNELALFPMAYAGIGNADSIRNLLQRPAFGETGIAKKCVQLCFANHDILNFWNSVKGSEAISIVLRGMQAWTIHPTHL
jgi:hypothetical protein